MAKTRSTKTPPGLPRTARPMSRSSWPCEAKHQCFYVFQIWLKSYIFIVGAGRVRHSTTYATTRLLHCGLNKLQAGGRHGMPPPLSYLCGRRSALRAAEPTVAPADGNVAVTVGSNGEYFPTLTAAAAWCVKAAVNKVAW